YAEARRTRRHGRRAGDPAVARLRGPEARGGRRRAVDADARAAAADYHRAAARRDVDADGPDPPDVSEDVAPRTRSEPPVGQGGRVDARGRGDRARSTR